MLHRESSIFGSVTRSGDSVTRDPRYDILFEPIQLGPVVAKNRFYQVPHCCGMGHQKPNTAAAMRGMKAQGGWAVVSTEECDVHHSSDISPYLEQRLWDDHDIPQLAKMVDAVHEHGSLAAIELSHSGIHSHNHYTRSMAMAPSAGPTPGYAPTYAGAMTKRDIVQIREVFRKSALRARTAGFDVVYVYAAHMLTLPAQFLSRRFNRRTDEYGGTLENRIRLLREMILDAKDAVGETCAIAVRFMMDELLGDDGLQCNEEGIEIVGMLAELPDLWDVNISDWDNDSATSRFQPEGFQEQFVCKVKQVTTKPVVGVGRFTSPDTMVSQIRRGVLDMIGAARPSIADPFLPKKIEQGRIEDIRECIGCNICVFWGLHNDAYSLHPKPDDGRRMAAWLASGKYSPDRFPAISSDRGWRTRRAGMRSLSGKTWLRGNAGGFVFGAGRSGNS